MRSRVLRYAVGMTVLLIVGYNSVYFRSLTEVKAASATEVFDAAAYARQYWNSKVVPALSTTIDYSELLKQLNENPAKAFKEHSHALGIGNIRYFMVRGKGMVTSVDENDVSILSPSSTTQVSGRLATEFVYGNAIRDAVGGIDLTKFNNTANLNAVSAEINRKIREEIIPQFKAKVEKGDSVQFVGAIELNKKYLDLSDIEIIPVSITITQ